MPFILLVETMTSGTMIPRVTTRYVVPKVYLLLPIFLTPTENSFKHITSLLLFVIAVYSAVYGVSYAYLLHHLANILAAWLVGVYFFSSGFPVRRLWRILEGDDLSSDVGGSHVKKKP